MTRIALRKLQVIGGVALAAALLWTPMAYGDEGLAPWWGVTSSARPSSIRAGVATNEVKQITVKQPENPMIFIGRLPGTSNIIPIIIEGNATREIVQAKFEAAFGAGTVNVSGGPGTDPYTITFAGALAFQEIALEQFGGNATVTKVTPGKADGQISVAAVNLGDKNASGAETPIRIEDRLPRGLRPVAAVAVIPGVYQLPGVSHSSSEFHCSGGGTSVLCTYSGILRPYEILEARIGVVVEVGAVSGEVNTASASGGGATATRTSSLPIGIGGEPTFGLEEVGLTAEEATGATDTQAGSHPFQLTSTLTFNHGALTPIPDGENDLFPVSLPRDASVLVPPGLIGNPTSVAQCSDREFVSVTAVEGKNLCPPSSIVGVAAVTFDEPTKLHLHTSISPVYNLVPEGGEPARFGFQGDKDVPVMLDTAIRAGSDYGVTVSAHDISEIPGFISSSITFWGVPGDPRHDGQRGVACLLHEESSCPLSGGTPPPFLSMPTSCTGPLRPVAEADSWEAPSEVVRIGAAEPMPAMDGCNHLSFSPEIEVTPDDTTASSPTGLKVDVHVPQTAALNPEGLAEAYPKDITVALPEGVAVNPAGGDGLQACSEDLAGFTGFSEVAPGTRSATFTSSLPSPLQPGVNFCPNASKIGTVKIKTPILPNPLEGAVYLATQNENPFGSLVAVYLVAEDPVSGVLVKLAGNVHLSAAGQIVTTFENSPQAPFEDAELHFFGGERAPLASPTRCGAYTTTSKLVAWSENAASEPSSTFEITSGPHGTACPGLSLPFSPSLTAGTTGFDAAAFSPLTTIISREDGDQNIQSVQLHMPPGLLGSLVSVKLCGEAEANTGTCGSASLIGETTVSAGVGSDPVTVTGGKVYITGPYHGAPFGLSIVNPVKAGPFDLEHDTSNPANQPACDCIVVRARVELDPHTTALSVTTNSETEGYAIPHMIDGIPVQIKKINVLVNRSGFTFNPTNCNSLTLTGSIVGGEGANASIAVPFQVANCALLKFAPKLSASTSGKPSRLHGASLSVKLLYPKAAFGTQANIAKVKVSLPKQLPSRLKTLQKACPAASFDRNPAGCPAASIVGHTKAVTPLLPVPLEGPAYFVSNGGEAFPNLIMVLQGYGVTLDLVGDTFISKAGITSSTFKTVPDAPVGSFELNLPEGNYSALAANGNLCKSKLSMPTEFVAQNGAMVHQTTTVKVTECHSAKRRKPAKRKAGGHPRHRAKRTKGADRRKP